MACLFPRNLTIKTKTGKFMTIQASCNKCPECLKATRRDWFIRCFVELQTSPNSQFITLTYNDDNLPRSHLNHQPCFSVRDIQLFMKRLRQNLGCKGIKYFIASEYGGKFGRPHYHGLIFNIPNEKISSFPLLLDKSWSLGFTSCSNINPRRIGYVCKYMLQKTQTKNSYSDPALAPFYLSSRNPALGSSYLTDEHRIFHLSNRETKFNLYGLNYPLPKYYRRKIFDDYEDIKEEMRNDYIAKNNVDILNLTASDDAYHAHNQAVQAHQRNVLRRFKKYQKQQFDQELTDQLDYKLRTI